MVLEIKETENPKLDQLFKDFIKEIDKFFELGWTHHQPMLIVVKDRKTMDALYEEKTEDWFVGWVSNNTVHILSEKNYEKESNHKYSKEKYAALIKHELTHCFYSVVGNSKGIPIWLNEGICIVLSGQNKLNTKPKKLENFLEFHDKGGEKVYWESGFAVEYLVKTFGKEKLLTLIKRTKEINSKEEFAKLFKSVYNFELSYDNFKVL